MGEGGRGETGREKGRERGQREGGGGGRGMTNLYHLPFHLKVVSSVAIRCEPHILAKKKTKLIIKVTHFIS